MNDYPHAAGAVLPGHAVLLQRRRLRRAVPVSRLLSRSRARAGPVPALSYIVTATGAGPMAGFNYNLTVDPTPAGVGVLRTTVGGARNMAAAAGGQQLLAGPQGRATAADDARSRIHDGGTADRDGDRRGAAHARRADVQRIHAQHADTQHGGLDRRRHASRPVRGGPPQPECRVDRRPGHRVVGARPGHAPDPPQRAVQRDRGQIVVDPNPAGASKLTYSGLGQLQLPTNPDDATATLLSVAISHATRRVARHSASSTSSSARGCGSATRIPPSPRHSDALRRPSSPDLASCPRHHATHSVRSEAGSSSRRSSAS